ETAEILKKENFARGVVVRQEDNHLHIDMYTIANNDIHVNMQMVIFLTYNDTAGKVFFSEDFGYSISNLAFGSHADNPVAFDCCTTSNRGNHFIGNANAAVICMELNGHNHPPLGPAPNDL